MIDTLLIAAGAFAGGCFVGWKVANATFKAAVKRSVQNTVEAAHSFINENVVEVLVECEGDKLFMYKATNHEFIAQAEDIQQCQRLLDEKFPGKFFTLKVDEEYVKRWAQQHDAI